MTKKNAWCEPENVHLDIGGYYIKRGETLKIPARVRCQKCKKRFKPFVKECDDSNDNYRCVHVYMPKHKKSVKC